VHSDSKADMLAEQREIELEMRAGFEREMRVEFEGSW
jgi:hypothetical protein